MESMSNGPSCCNSVCFACEPLPQALMEAIPEIYHRIKFEELKHDRDYSRNFVVGKVFKAFPISKRAKGFFRKLLLSEAAAKVEEDKSDKKLNMFILNENEKQLESIDDRSFVAVSGFIVENLTSASGNEDCLPVQVIVKISCNGSDTTMLWIARSLASPLNDSTCSISQSSDGEEMDVDDPRQLSSDEEDFHALVREYSQREQISSSDESDEISIESDESLLPQAEKSDTAQGQNSKAEKSDEAQGQNSKSRKRSATHENDLDQANPVPETSNRRYVYTRLNDLEESITPDYNFSIYGIVVNCYFKPRASDQDKLLELILKDSTVDFFRCRVTGKCNDKFPDVYPGDIIRIHRVVVDKFRDKFKGRCFSPKFIVVFDGKTNDHEPRCVAKTFVFTADDRKKVQELRELANKKPLIRLISEINVDDFVTIVCQVVNIHLHNESVLLKVWDGTISPIIDNSLTKSYMHEKTDEKLFNISKNYLVPIWINGDYVIAAGQLKPGQYIKVRDVNLYAPKSKPNEPRLAVHPQTKLGRGVELLDPADEDLQELKSRLQKVWEEASVGEEITMGITPSFMKEADASNIGTSPTSENFDPNYAQSTFGRPGTSGGNQHASQINEGASQAMSAPPVPSQKILSALNQGIDPASNMELAIGSQQLLTNLQSRPAQEIEERMIVDEVQQNSPSSTGKSPTMKEGGKRVNTGSDVDNASKKRRLDSQNQDAGTGSSTSEPYDTAPSVSDSESAAATPPSNQAVLNTSLPESHPSPYLGSSVFNTSQPESSLSSSGQWWKLTNTVSESVGHGHIPPTYIKDVISHFTPYKFRVFVTVLNIDPKLDSIRKLIRLYCPKCHYISVDADPDLEVFETRNGVPMYFCARCLNNSMRTEEQDCMKQELEYTFLTAFAISDGTGMIDVYLWKENAVKFFKGIRPEDALTDCSQARLVRQMLWDICPNCRPLEFSNETSAKTGSYYPILDCSIMSYTAGGKTRYQIFDSVLK